MANRRSNPRRTRDTGDYRNRFLDSMEITDSTLRTIGRKMMQMIWVFKVLKTTTAKFSSAQKKQNCLLKLNMKTWNVIVVQHSCWGAFTALASATQQNQQRPECIIQPNFYYWKLLKTIIENGIEDLAAGVKKKKSSSTVRTKVYCYSK